ncbi:MAG: transporter [Gemmatimonadaceae bacterium]|nr:transporter [Gemmatimonadaceae bacterium]
MRRKSSLRTLRRVERCGRGTRAASLHASSRYALSIASALLTTPLLAQQPLETETARLPLAGEVLIAGTFEFQTSNQGTERAAPIAIEVGVTDRFTLLAEPVLYTSIRPSEGFRASGIGDLEVTGQFLARREQNGSPALALGAEVKFPTARNSLIGTGKTDFTPYLIASQRFGSYDVHANVGYSFVGKPAGLSVQNTWNFALAAERHFGSSFDFVGEVLASTAASKAGDGENSPTAPEVAGAEFVGMLGGRYRVVPNLWFTFGVTYDNSGAVLFRPGITTELRF